MVFCFFAGRVRAVLARARAAAPSAQQARGQRRGRGQQSCGSMRRACCSGSRNGAAGAMKMQMQMHGELQAIPTGTRVRGSTTCSGGIRIGGRVVLVRPLLLLLRVRVALHRLRPRFWWHRCSKTNRSYAACYETHDTMSSGRVRGRVRAATVFVRKGVEQAADAEPTGCRARAFFAMRCGTVCVRPRREGKGRNSYRSASTRRPTAHTLRRSRAGHPATRPDHRRSL